LVIRGFLAGSRSAAVDPQQANRRPKTLLFVFMYLVLKFGTSYGFMETNGEIDTIYQRVTISGVQSRSWNEIIGGVER
jgi:hypothetical protein